jgi:hypothetical protein
MKKLIIILVVLTLFGCKGDDGSDGKVYITLDWTSDITAFDFTAFEKESHSYYMKNTRYELQPDTVGYIGWISNGTAYTLLVGTRPAESGSSGSSEYILFPKDGEDGKDRISDMYFSGNTMSTTREYLENIIGDLSSETSIPSTIIDMENAIPGEIVKE